MTKHKFLVIALCISLVLNLGVIGYLIGQNIAGQRASEENSELQIGFARLLRSLPHERVEKLMPDLEHHRKSMRSLYGKVIDTRNQLYKAMHAEPFDINVLRKRSEMHARALTNARHQSDEFFIELYDQLSPQERRDMFAKAFKEMQKSKESE